MAYTQAQMLADFRDHLGDVNTNERTDYQLINALRRAYEAAWPDWYQEVRDDDTYTGYASRPPGTLSVPVPSAFVGGRIYNIFGRTNIYQQGTAFTSLVNSNWIAAPSVVSLPAGSQIQLNGTAIPTGLSTNTAYYPIFPALRSVGITYTNANPILTTASNHPWAIGTPMVLSGNVPSSFTAGVVYYVVGPINPNTFQLATAPLGTAINAVGNSTCTVSVAGFQHATSATGTPISFTTAGSGYYGSYVDPTYEYQPFNMWTRGILIDSLTSSSPRIRFTMRDNIPFEIRIKGAGQLSYPYVTVTAAGTDTFTVTGTSISGTTYTPTLNDTVYFWATAPVSFTSGGNGAGGLTPYYVVSPTATTFKLAVTVGGAAISTTSTGSFNILPGSQTLPGTDYQWLSLFLRWQGEVFARAGLQRSGNLDRRAQAQRRLLAGQEADKARSHRMQPVESSMFSWDA